MKKKRKEKNSDGELEEERKKGKKRRNNVNVLYGRSSAIDGAPLRKCHPIDPGAEIDA